TLKDQRGWPHQEALEDSDLEPVEGVCDLPLHGDGYQDRHIPDEQALVAPEGQSPRRQEAVLPEITSSAAMRFVSGRAGPKGDGNECGAPCFRRRRADSPSDASKLDTLFSPQTRRGPRFNGDCEFST